MTVSRMSPGPGAQVNFPEQTRSQGGAHLGVRAWAPG